MEEITKIKKKSDERKRQLRRLNQKMQLYIAVADAALSDAARWETQCKYWQEKYLELLDEKLEL